MVIPAAGGNRGAACHKWRRYFIGSFPG